MNYGEVALGVECALPAGFDMSRRRGGPNPFVFCLLLVLTAAAML